MLSESTPNSEREIARQLDALGIVSVFREDKIDGSDVASITLSEAGAVLAAGYRRQETGAKVCDEWGLNNPEQSIGHEPYFTGSEQSVRKNHRRGLPSIRIVRRTVSEWVPVTEEGTETGEQS